MGHPSCRQLSSRTFGKAAALIDISYRKRPVARTNFVCVAARSIVVRRPERPWLNLASRAESPAPSLKPPIPLAACWIDRLSPASVDRSRVLTTSTGCPAGARP